MKKVFTWIYDHLEYFLAGFLFFCVVFIATSGFSSAFRGKPEEITYTSASKLFNDSKVHKIEVWLDPEDLESLRENAAYKLKYHASVKIDNDFFDNVAFSTRGNASLTTLISDNSENKDFLRFSYKINFEKYDKNTTYFGLDELVLNNLFADPSGMRDFLAFEIMRAAGVETPLTSYTELYINNTLAGLYLAVEEVEKSFLERTENPKGATLFKPEAFALDHSEFLKLAEITPDPGGREALSKKLGININAEDPDFDFEGSTLIYTDNDPESYAAIFRNEVTKVSPNDRTRVIESLKALETGEKIEEFWDIDALAKYFAAHNFIINSDSYTGWTSHNYILKYSNGKGTFLPWDYNLAFQGLWLDEELLTPVKTQSWDIDHPLLGPELENRPLWRTFEENEEYMEKYHAALQALLDRSLVNGELEEKLEKTYALIRPYLVFDYNSFYPVEEMDDGVEYLKNFLFYRAESVQNQLWGLDGLENVENIETPPDFSEGEGEVNKVSESNPADFQSEDSPENRDYKATQQV